MKKSAILFSLLVCMVFFQNCGEYQSTNDVEYSDQNSSSNLDLFKLQEDVENEALSLSFEKNSLDGTNLNLVCDTATVSQSKLLSVTLFGAKGDGKNDDTQAIQSAIDCLSEILDNQNVKHLFFPSGTYKVSAPLKLIQQNANWSNLIISGESSSASVIRATKSGLNVFEILLNKPVKTIIFDLGFVSEVVDAGSAVFISAPEQNLADPTQAIASNFLMSSVHISGAEARNVRNLRGHIQNQSGRLESFRHGVRGQGLMQPYFKDVHIKSSAFPNTLMSGYKSMFQGSCISLTGGYGVHIRDSECFSKKIGLNLKSKGGNSTIKDNHSFGVGVDIALKIDAGEGHVHISRSHANSYKWNYFIQNASRTRISDNLTFASDFSPAKGDFRGSIYIENSKNTVIEKNTFSYSHQHCSKFNKHRSTIRLAKGTAGTKVLDNIFDETRGAGIFVESGASATLIKNNFFTDLEKLKVVDQGTGTQIRNEINGAIGPMGARDFCKNPL